MLTRQTIAGIGWSLGARLATRLIDFFILLALARILSPADFGIVALASTLVAIADTVLEISLIQALTRIPSVARSHLDTAFTLGIIRSLLLGGVILVLAWPFAAAYQDERLAPLLLALTIAPVARGLFNPAMVRYSQAMRFRPFFVGQIIGKVLGLVIALYVAFVGGAYWAIVAGALATAVSTTIVSYIQAPYLPRLSLREFGSFMSFLSWFSLSQLISALGWQIDRALLGLFAPRADLGRYAVASDLAVLPTQSIIGPSMQPIMSAFSQLQAEPARLQGAFLKTSQYTIMLAAPAAVLLATLANLLVSVMFEPEWADAADYLRWISLTLVFSAYIQPMASFAAATNQLKTIFVLSLLDLFLKVVLFPIGLIYGGIGGLIIMRAIIGLINFLACLVSASHLTGVSIARQLTNLWKPAIATGVMAGASVMSLVLVSSSGMPVFLQLGLATASSCAVFGLSLSALGVKLPISLSLPRGGRRDN
jgi:O-antigen/teichoic acid export membrane protein